MTTRILELEQYQEKLFEKCAPSVVFIETTSSRHGFLQQPTEVPAGQGSGFVWDSKGHIVTNLHVLRGATAATVIVQGGKGYKAELVGADQESDLAVLRINAKGLVPLERGESKKLRVGQFTAAIGNPFGLDHTFTTGVVSALGRHVRGSHGQTIRGCIQTDAAINPGNSGGPLLDITGKLIGVTVAIASPSGAYAGIGFAIPVDVVKRVVGQILQYGKVKYPSLSIVAVNDELAHGLLEHTKVPEGVLVLRATGNAHRAGIRGATRTASGGIRLGDVITEINGKKVRGVDDLLESLEGKSAGESVKVTVASPSTGATRTVSVQLVDRDALRASL